MKKKIAAGIVTFKLTDEYTEILLLDSGSFWNFPKGKVENGETIQQAALREFHEETGIEPVVMSLEPVYSTTFIFKKNSSDVEETLHLFAGIVDYDSEVILSGEHIDYDWVHWRKARKLLKFESQKKALKKSMKWLESHNNAAEKLARNLEEMR